MTDRLRRQAGGITEEVTRLLADYSDLRPANPPGSSVLLISPTGDWFWNPLPAEAKALQARVLPKYDRFADLMESLARNLPSNAQNAITAFLFTARSAVAQSGSSWWKTTEEAIHGFAEAVNEAVATLDEYAEECGSLAILIPDTNALLLRPDLEKWRLRDPVCIDMVILPVILSELDNHKVNHKNEAVREKAQTLVRKMKEYRRRGPLHDGVVVVGGRLSLRAVAIEPSAERAPSWFDFSNADDRFLAAGLEIIRENLATPVYIVTADINMQNKAEFAGIPHLDVEALVSDGGH